MLKLGGALAAKPADDPLQPLPGTSEPNGSQPLARHALRALLKIRCITAISLDGQQDFIGRRVKFAITGAEVGDHRWPPPSGRRLGLATRPFGPLSPPPYPP